MIDHVWSDAFQNDIPLSKDESKFLWTNSQFTSDLRQDSMKHEKRPCPANHTTISNDSFVPMQPSVQMHQFSATLGNDPFEVVGYEYDKNGNVISEKLQSKMPPPDKHYSSQVGKSARDLQRCMGDTGFRKPKKEVENIINPRDLMHGDAEISSRRVAEQTELFSRSTYFNRSHQQNTAEMDTGREMYDGYNLKDDHLSRSLPLPPSHREDDARHVPIKKNPTVDVTVSAHRSRIKSKQGDPFYRKPAISLEETSKSKSSIHLKPEREYISREDYAFLQLPSAKVHSEISLNRYDAVGVNTQKHSTSAVQSQVLKPAIHIETKRNLKSTDPKNDQVMEQRRIDERIERSFTQRDIENEKVSAEQLINAGVARPQINLTAADDEEIHTITKNIQSTASYVRSDVSIGMKDDIESEQVRAKIYGVASQIRSNQDAVEQQREALTIDRPQNAEQINQAVRSTASDLAEQQREALTIDRPQNAEQINQAVRSTASDLAEQQREALTIDRPQNAEQINQAVRSTASDLAEQQREALTIDRPQNAEQINQAVRSAASDLAEKNRQIVNVVNSAHIQVSSNNLEQERDMTFGDRQFEGKTNAAFTNIGKKVYNEIDMIEQFRENAVASKRNISLPVAEGATVSLYEHMNTLREDEARSQSGSFVHNDLIRADISIPDRADASKIHVNKNVESRVQASPQISAIPSSGYRNDGKEVPRHPSSSHSVPVVRGSINLTSRAGTILLPDRLANTPSRTDSRRDIRTTPIPQLTKDRSTPTRAMEGRTTPLVEKRIIPPLKNGGQRE